jgi:septation ring formation regulator EzrA
MNLEERIDQLEKQKKLLQDSIRKFQTNRSLDTMDEVAYRELQSKVNELEGTLGSAQDINDNHQRYNGRLQTELTEVREDNKKLARQIEDLKMTAMRKSGL